MTTEEPVFDTIEELLNYRLDILKVQRAERDKKETFEKALLADMQENNVQYRAYLEARDQRLALDKETSAQEKSIRETADKEAQEFDNPVVARLIFKDYPEFLIYYKPAKETFEEHKHEIAEWLLSKPDLWGALLPDLDRLKEIPDWMLPAWMYHGTLTKTSIKSKL